MRTRGTIVELKLELVVVPVSDVDRAKAFYVDRAGFEVHVDVSPGGGMRVVQLNPPGSACSITIGTGLGDMAPGSLHGLHLVTDDIDEARAALVAGGVDISEPFHFGPEGRQDGPHPERADYGTFCSFSDPDGNSWVVQEVKVPTPRG
jgi:catechol 2,3-dioxygenase-like lactoylglutathione lyase family enzyme